MAKKKIVIENKPDEVETSVATPADEVASGEPEKSEETTSPKEPAAEIPEAGSNIENSDEEVTPTESQQKSEDNALEPPQEEINYVPPKRNRSIKKRQLLIIIVLIVAIAGGLYLLLKPSNPLPKSDTKLAKFTVYYPKSNGSGFTYSSGSASFTAGELTYSLEPKNSHVGAGGPIIRVNELAIKGTGPNLNALTDFTLLKVPAGNAAVGNNGDILNGVINTKTTLIILNGLDGATKQQLIDVMKGM
jgi:hypothetical protein